MIRGSESKEKITAKILETFPGAFKYEKEIRIPMSENGETIQIKCVLTAAKTNVESGEDNAIPGTVKVGGVEADTDSVAPATSSFMNEPTAEEKKNVEDLMQSLGLV